MHEAQTYLSPDMAHRLAAIDVGTNSIRMCIAEALRGGNYRVLDEEKETTRLGRELATTGHLDAGSVEQSIMALRRMKKIVAGFQVRELRVIGTCALREAANGPEFCQRVKDETDLDIEVITAEQEAHLAFLSVARAFALDGKNVAVADIGGGSTEVILATGQVVEAVCTAPLGAVRLMELFGPQETYADGSFEKMVRAVDRELKKQLRRTMLVPHLLIGSGGTFTTLAEMVMAEKRQSGMPLRGYEITHAEVHHTIDRLRKLAPKARRGLAGLSPDRADIIIPGLTIIDRILQHFHLNRLQVHDRGVRDGLLLTMLDQTAGGISHDPHHQEDAIERFAARCGVDLAHGRHVARLAGLIYSQLLDEFALDPADRPLLEAAARLQDVGYVINYEKHHKHSFHLILNSRLAGFQPHELELIANIARYHRGSEPRKKHAQFRRLAFKDQDRVRRVSSILRLAGGLDRSNTGQVKGLAVRVKPEVVEIDVMSDELPEVDLWAARRRSGPFERAFGRAVLIQWLEPCGKRQGTA